MRDEVHKDSRERRLPIDVRSSQEFTGEPTHMPDHPREGVLRGDHIPGQMSAQIYRLALTGDIVESGETWQEAGAQEVYKESGPQVAAN